MGQTKFSPEEIAFAKELEAKREQPKFTPEEMAFAKNRLPGKPNGLENVLKNTGGAVMKALEFIDRPRAMIVSGAQALKGDRPVSDILEAVKGNIHPSATELLPDMNVPIPSIKAGHRSGVDVDNSGKSANVKHAVGFGLDVAMDPVTYLTFGSLTKLGRAGKALANIGKVHGTDAMKGLMAKSPETIAMLRGKGVPQKLIDLAMKTDVPLAKTLPEQAKAGQWAAAKFAGATTPVKVNVPVAKAVTKTRQSLPKVPVINRFINRSGDDLWDEGVRNLDYQHRRRTNEIIDTGKATRKAIDDLGDKAFGGKSSAAWHESEGGVWMENLLNNKSGAKEIPQAAQVNMDRMSSLKGKALLDESELYVRSLMDKDLPEIAGLKPYFAPGKGEDIRRYALHNIAGMGKATPRKDRGRSLFLLEDTLREPDFIYRQPNGNKYFGTVYNNGGTSGLHAVITEVEKDGRIREVTQFVYGNRSGDAVNKELKKKFRESTLEYLGNDIKKGGRTYPSTPPPSVLQGQGTSFASTADKRTVVAPDESVKLAMSQRVTRLTNQQREEMKRLGIPITEINEAGYAYVPHTLTDEAAKGAKGGGVSRFHNSRPPNTKTPHSLQRDYKWITDPETGEAFIGSVRDFAEKKGINPDILTTRNATVDEINAALGANKFKTDLAEATTEAALRNERAISGAEQLNFFYDNAQVDLKRVGGEAPPNWRRVRLEVPEKFISQDGNLYPIRDTLTKLTEIPMPPEKARVIEGRWKVITKPDAVEKQLKDLYMGYESAWKRFTLFLFPEYHSRNAVGDLWNGWMHGWRPQQIGKDLHDAARLQMTGGRGISFKAGAYGNLRGEDIVKAARDYGVVGTGQLSEIKDILAPMSTPKGKSIAKKIKDQVWDLKGPVAVGEALENNRRLGFFIRRLKEGDTFDEAARTVANALYDYGDITPFENSVMKRVFPFYTWSRKNIPAQAENLIRRPGKVALMPKLKGAVEGAQGENIPPEEVRPEWMRREFSIYNGKNPNGKENFVMLGSYLPTTDIFKFASEPEDVIANVSSSMSPPIKIASELLANRDFYRERPVDQLRESGDWSDLLWGNQQTNYLGKNMPTTAQRLSELLPFTRALATLDRMNPGGLFDQYAVTEDGKTRPYHTELTSGQKWLKTLTGLKNYPVDMERDYAFRIKDLKNDPSRAPGLNVANVKMMAKRAYIEGDMKGYEHYMNLLAYLNEKMEREIGLWEMYSGK